MKTTLKFTKRERHAIYKKALAFHKTTSPDNASNTKFLCNIFKEVIGLEQENDPENPVLMRLLPEFSAQDPRRLNRGLSRLSFCVWFPITDEKKPGDNFKKKGYFSQMRQADGS